MRNIFTIPAFGLRGRLVLWAAFGTGAAVVAGVAIFYFAGLSSIQGTLGQTYCQIASSVVDEFETDVERESNRVANIATDVLTTEVLFEATSIYHNRDDYWKLQRQSTRALEWKEEYPDGKLARFLHIGLSRRLNVLAGLNGDKVVRFAVYDEYGVLVAASSFPPEGTAADERWYTAAQNQDNHFLLFDTQWADSHQQLIVATPVWGGVDVVGYVVATFNLGELAANAESKSFGQSGEVFLVDYAGVPLLKNLRSFLVSAMSHKPAPENQIFSKGRELPAYWMTLEEGDEWLSWERLLCVAPLSGINAHRVQFGLPPWAAIITQSPSESYASLQKSLGSFAVAGVIGVLFSIIGAAVIAWHIATPLKDLRDGVQRFAKGERDHPVNVSSSDEVGELAQEFNRMMRRVTASENELRTFAQGVEAAADAIIMTSLDGVIYYANTAFQRITGYSPEEVIGKSPSMLRSEDTPDSTYQEMWRAIEEGGSWRGELANRHKDGRSYRVDLTISPVMDDDGQSIALLGVHRDITLAHEYQDRLEREVFERTREIRDTQGLTAMGRMASMVAHDLRNALSTVKMNLQILSRRKDGKVAPNEHEHWGMARDQVSYMEAILSDMLSYARPDKLNRDWCDLPPIIDEALISESHRMSGSGIEFVYKPDQNLPKVNCDRPKLLAVLRNLIGNAIQAMASGGELKVECWMVIGEDIPSLQIAVSDTGKGIPTEVLGDVFQPFFTTRAKGTGLGLAIVKRIVEQHGGTVEVDSDQRYGTTIRFTLPVNSDRP
jgi:PAS domain S-box-containing protein